MRRGVAALLLWVAFVSWAFAAGVPRAADASGGDASRVPGPLRVTVLLEHEPLEGTFAGLVTKGVRDAAGSAMVEVRVVPLPEDREEALRRAAKEGGLVVVSSDGFHAALRDNANNFRRTMFGCLDASVRAKNIMSVTFADEQGAFLAGAAAAMATVRAGIPGINPDATIGFLAGEDVPAIRSLFWGYSEGARLVRPGVRVVQGVAGSFDAPDAAVREAGRLLDQGADVVLLAAGNGNAAAREAIRAKGAHVVVMDVPDVGDGTLISVGKRADRAAAAVVAAARGTFPGGEILTYDLANDGVVVGELGEAVSRADPELARDVARRLGELRREIATGGIRLKSLRERTLCDCQQ
ncbi:MAG: BMP family ABC transporter substrate-binding protein [Desulfovibrio sp.]|jgi:basic membrane protein A|nr:BMP family ABC transporter substrate-binding protein [Desulfovibrio sp.]